MIVPLPQGVFLTHEQAERKASQLIRYLFWETGTIVPDDLVLRTYLIASNDYKRRIEQSGLDLFVKRLYRGKPMPRWIWVSELSSVDSYNSSELTQRWLIRGEAIMDATSPPWSPDFVALHVILDGRGLIATMQPDDLDAEQALQRMWTGPEAPYKGWVR